MAKKNNGPKIDRTELLRTVDRKHPILPLNAQAPQTHGHTTPLLLACLLPLAAAPPLLVRATAPARLRLRLLSPPRRTACARPRGRNPCARRRRPPWPQGELPPQCRLRSPPRPPPCPSPRQAGWVLPCLRFRRRKRMRRSGEKQSAPRPHRIHPPALCSAPTHIRPRHRRLRPPPDGLLPCPRASACTSSLPGCISASARTSSPSSYCDTIAGNLFDQIPCLPCFIQLVSLG